jgi:hypothetical protein
LLDTGATRSILNSSHASHVSDPTPPTSINVVGNVTIRSLGGGLLRLRVHPSVARTNMRDSIYGSRSVVNGPCTPLTTFPTFAQAVSPPAINALVSHLASFTVPSITDITPFHFDVAHTPPLRHSTAFTLSEPAPPDGDDDDVPPPAPADCSDSDDDDDPPSTRRPRASSKKVTQHQQHAPTSPTPRS